MSTSAALIVVAIALLLAVLIAFDQLSRRAAGRLDPDCTLEKAWLHFLGSPRRWPENQQRAIAAIDDRETAFREIEPELSETLGQVLAAPVPAAALRLAIMDATERFVLYETMAESSGTELRGVPDGLLEAGVLRAFGARRWGDFARDDWYSQYLRMARANARNVAAMVRKTVRGELDSFEAGLHDPLGQAMREARDVLIRLPAGAPVDRATRLDLGRAVLRREPSEAQIEALVALLGDHFERVFSGELYRSADGEPIPPAASVRLDAALLFVHLASEFRLPVGAWGKVLERALGGRIDLSGEERELLQVGQEARRAWLQHESDRPVAAALETACRLALGDETRIDSTALRRMRGAVGADAEALLSSMREATRQSA